MAPQCLGREIRRNDIVVFNSGASELPLIKRVVAVPGDRFTLKESHLRVNNTRLRNSTGEPFYFASGAEKLIALYENQFRGILPREVFFVLGDSDGVLDSARFGPVNLQDILYVGVSK